MYSANSTVYKVKSPINSPPNSPTKNVRKVEEHRQIKVCEVECESPNAIVKICTNDGTWRSRRDFNAEENTLLKIPPHENIVQCYGVVTDSPNHAALNSKIGFLMEYCPGGDLQSYLKSTELARERVLTMIEELIKPVLHLHQLNIIHRDIKSPNYLVTGGKVKLCDFGLSRENTAYNRDTTFRKSRSSLIWTAPELYDYNIDEDSDEVMSYSFRSDVYSVTVVVWETLNTWLDQKYSIPIAGNVYKVMHNVLGGKRPNVSNFPSEWVSILEKGWDRAADKRPTIYELLTMVQDIK